MEGKENLDMFGVTSLVLFALLLAFNQVVIKVVNEGFQPVFFAGIRSAGAAFCVWAWIRVRGRKFDFQRRDIGPGLLLGSIFGSEFLFLFIALDLTSVTRTSILFYTMPVWLAIMAHFVLPGERIGRLKALGLALSFIGMAWAISGRGQGEDVSLTGDLFALVAAVLWAGIPLTVRLTSLSRLRPEMQLMWQLTVSAPFLLIAALFFGPVIRDLEPIHIWGLAFQVVVVVTAGFMFWLWLISIYPASGVASFSFLTPIFGIFFGWLMLGEQVGPRLLGAGALVAIGLVLINRRDADRAD